MKAKLYFISELRGESLVCLRAIAPNIKIPYLCHHAAIQPQLFHSFELELKHLRSPGSDKEHLIANSCVSPFLALGSVSLGLEQTLVSKSKLMSSYQSELRCLYCLGSMLSVHLADSKSPVLVRNFSGRTGYLI